MGGGGGGGGGMLLPERKKHDRVLAPSGFCRIACDFTEMDVPAVSELPYGSGYFDKRFYFYFTTCYLIFFWAVRES